MQVADLLKAMVEVPGGTFRMGSERFYPEEAPVREESVDGFWIDRHPVTVAEFRRFVKATGYVTWAERAPDADDYPDADPELLVPGSLVFGKTAGPVPLDDYRNWWTWVPGADWRHPEGPGAAGSERRAELLCTARPARSSGGAFSSAGDQGRIASLRTELLPALPAGCPSGRDDRQHDRPHRFSLRRPFEH